MTDETLANASDEPSLPKADPPAAAGESPEPAPEAAPEVAPGKPWHPSYAFLAIVSFVSLAADFGTKWWAKTRLDAARPWDERHVELIKDHLAFTFARNKGGAWGLLQDENDAVRKPFFLLISLAAIVFIFSLYRKLAPKQLALKWGLPLVLGGALGNLVDRIRYGHVIDFIDVRAGWIRSINAIFTAGASDHWPTFNIADVAICVGVGLMAVDMFTSRKASRALASPSA
jgi:signal peptidase II